MRVGVSKVLPARAQAARRALKNRALYYLGELGDGKVTADLLRRTREATNMTDHIAALAALTDHPGAPYPMPVCPPRSNPLAAACSMTGTVGALDCPCTCCCTAAGTLQA